MRTGTRDIKTIRPYEGNPRANDAAVDAVAHSITEFGFRQPIVVDSDGVIICGHTRYKAALKLGLQKVPVHVVTDLTPAQVRAYRLADNKTADLSTWDLKLLPIELADLQEANVDFELLGFSPADLARLLPPDAEEGLTDPDVAPDPPAEPVTRPGDLWVLGDHRLLCGDATKAEDMKRLMDGTRATMCFTDPPWNVAIGQDSNPRHRQRDGLQNDNLSGEEFKAFVAAFAARLVEALDGDLYCVLGASEWPTLDNVLRAGGWHWSATIIWVKHIFVLGRSKYHRRYEPLWYGWHKDRKSSFQSARDLDDVWEIPRPTRSEEHPTMKPVALVKTAILNSSVAGDIVVDPFLGSGTTVVAATSLNRRCYGMEIEPAYCDVVVQRWEQFTGGKAKR